jgi:glycosyltransferase involved in cell wall biosynthesis
MQKLNVHTPINGLSYGICGLNIIRELDKEYDVSFFPIGQASLDNSPTPESDSQLLNKLFSNSRFYSKDADSIRIWHQHDLAQHVGKGRHIGFPIFEVNRFEPYILNHLLNQDALFVPSHWAKTVLEENNVNVPIYVVPLGVDSSIFNYQDTPTNSTCRFLNIGKWEVRKGHSELLEAFNLAFSPKDDVELIMLPVSSHTTQEEVDDWGRMYKESSMGEKIQIANRLPLPQLVNLMKVADCGVFLSHAEGWNLPLLEMMACGKQVIATNYSAHTEYCTKDNCYLVEIDGLESAYDGRWFHGFAEWAEIGEKQIKQCADYMRAVYDDKKAGNKTINLNGVETAKQFSWGNSCKKVVEALKSLNQE